MSLNNISLPSHLLAELYQNALVQHNAMPVPEKAQVPFLGKNQKNILIVVDKKEAPYLPDNELSFLTNVLSACQLGLQDVAIVNWNKLMEKNYRLVVEQLKSKEVILFDVSPTVFALPESFPQYAVGSTDENKFVIAPSLSDIESKKEAKKQLWMALKQLFSI
jgi:DNA polymerase III psi subunit